MTTGLALTSIDSLIINAPAHIQRRSDATILFIRQHVSLAYDFFFYFYFSLCLAHPFVALFTREIIHVKSQRYEEYSGNSYM